PQCLAHREQSGVGQGVDAGTVQSPPHVSWVPAPGTAAHPRPAPGGRSAADVSPRRTAPVHLLGRGAASARGRGPADLTRQTRLRHPAAAGDLWPPRPRGRGVNPRCSGLATRTHTGPRAQGRTFHRLSPVAPGRGGLGGVPPTWTA